MHDSAGDFLCLIAYGEDKLLRLLFYIRNGLI